jgi:transcriptional regulator
MSEIVNKLLENSNNESPLTLKYSREHIAMRRTAVLQMQAMGESETSIARSLGVSQATISLDCACLREMAKNKIAEHLAMRRAAVLQMQAMGESESSIARSLGCSQAIISLDVQFLRSQARDEIAEHLGNLAYELDKVLTGLDILIKTAYSWLNAPQFTTTTTVKDRTMILSLISNLYNMKWQLLTDKDPNAIHRVTNYVNKAKKELEEKIEWAQMRWDLTDEELDEEEEEQEENV